MDDRRDTHSPADRRRALWSLLLLLPVPTLGTWAGMIGVPGPLGQAVFAAAKLWILLLPLVWHFGIENRPWSWSAPRRGGFGVGALLGVAIGAVIWGAWVWIGAARVDPEALTAMAAEVGLGRPRVYLAMAAYWICVNSLLEEYVWRWFVTTRLERLVGPRWAIAGSAAGFTAHHVVAMSVYLDPGLNLLASSGLFVGGAVWSWCYLRYRSVWPAWLSHVVADVVIFVVGWQVIFG